MSCPSASCSRTRAEKEAGSTLAKPVEGRGVDSGDDRRTLEADAYVGEGVPITLKESHCDGRPWAASHSFVDHRT